MNPLLPNAHLRLGGTGLRQRIRHTLGLCLALGAPHFAQAGAPATDADLESELKFLAAERQVVVTASKLQENVEKTVATTSVITQDDIRHIGARNLLDVLRLVPGIGVTQSALGVRQIEVRGVQSTFSDKVLFMLNGHPLDHNLQNAGSTWVYDDLPVDTIKRVEVVRGPGSALYGANAFMAVINIITQNAKDLDGFQASVGAGSFGAQQYRASWGKQYANTAEAALHFNHTDTDGISSPIQQDSLSVQGLPSLAPGKSNLYEGRNDMEWQLGYQGFKLDGRYINKNTGTFVGPALALSNSSVQNYEDYFIRLSRNWKIAERWSVDTQVFHDSFSFDNLLQVAPDNFGHVGLQNTRDGGEVQGNYQLSQEQTIIGGVSYNQDNQSDVFSANGPSPSQLQPGLPFGKPRNRTRWGVYAQDVWDLWSNLRLTLGARYDRYNDFGGTFNPRLGFNWEFAKDYALKFSYGTAYRAPAFGELDLFNNPVLSGNPNLSPERAETFEGGLIAHPIQGMTAQATYYHTDITDLISSVPGQTTLLQYANNGKMLSEGVEMENRYDFGGNLQGSYIAANVVYQHTLLNSSAAADVPKARANVMVNWAFNSHWSVYGHALLKDATQRGAGDTRPDVPGYAVFDMSLLGQHFFSKRVDVSFTIYNLLDKTYFDPAPASIPGDFQQARRAFFGHINVRY